MSETTTEAKSTDSEKRFFNVRVASRVMGWTHWKDLAGDAPEGVTCFADWGDSNALAVYTPEDETGDVAFYFNPAEDLKDAWQIVEKFAAMKDTRERHSFTMRLRWAIEDRTGEPCLDTHVILKVKPIDICVAAIDALTKGAA